ncbi:helix-turn-helix domain-containing protein [Brevibacterium sp. FME17]|uniref:helix-turn-helix domain-containing protein n=1 Tax=Brevibacterium sp. FME17 TaxID=2742606 RepID=UPI0039AE9774
MADLAARSGVGGSQAWAWPLIVDGIIVVATVAVVALAGQRSAWYPWALLIGGALVSVTANAIHAVVAADADVPGVLAAAVAAVPPVVLLAITHLTVILTRPQLAAEVPASTDESAIEEPGPDAAWEPVSAVTPADAVEATALSAPTRQENDPVAAPGTRQASAARRADPHVDAAAGSADRRARAAALRGQGWSNKKIARELGVHPSTVGRWFTSAHLPDTTEHVDAEEAKDV